MLKTPFFDNKGNPVPNAPVQNFLSRLRSEVVLPTNHNFDEARRVWNYRIDRSPSAIIFCENTADIAYTIEFVREYDIPLSIRSGGHSIGGQGIKEGSLNLDLQLMKGVQVDPKECKAWCQPGLRVGDLDHETHFYGLACPMGEVSLTGISGLTLGGGYGLLSQKYGLTCDNLLNCELVNAKGQIIRANHDENSDLFWGLRGAGGNFGIVTQFTYRLHPVKDVLGGFVAHRLEDALSVLQFFRESHVMQKKEITLRASFVCLPDASPILLLRFCYVGNTPKGKKLIDEITNFGSPVAVDIQHIPFTLLQKSLDANVPSGVNYCARSNFIRNFSDEAIKLLIDSYRQSPSSKNAIFLEPGGGAIASVPKDETAFFHRDFFLSMLVVSAWDNKSDSDKNIKWTVDTWKDMFPYLDEGVYVNYLDDEGPERVKAAYGGHYPKLVKLKQKYDPTNIFSSNHNIAP